MGIVQAATLLQTAALARQQRIGLRRISRLSSSRPFWKYQQQQPQPLSCCSSYSSHGVDASFLAIPLPVYNQRRALPPPHSPIRGMAATADRRCFASSSLSSTDTFRQESRKGIIIISSDNDDDDENNNINNDVVIRESVNDLEIEVMRQMASKLNTSCYNAHTWFDAEDALKWWSSQRTVESVHICFALLDRFVQETAASSQQQILDHDNQQDDDSINVINTNTNQSSSSSTMRGLASFLDWRLMGAIMGNWTAVMKECFENINSNSRNINDSLHLLQPPRIVLERLDRYAQEHPQVAGFGVGASGAILSNVLNTAITQSRAMLRLGSGGGSLQSSRHDDDDDDANYSLSWYAENQSRRSQQKEATTTTPILREQTQQPPTTFQQEQQFSFLTMDNRKNHNNKSAVASPHDRSSSTLINDDESDEHDIVEMVRFCTRVLDRLLDEYSHHDNDDDDDRDTTTHQRSSRRHHGKNNNNVPRSSVYFCNSVLHLWSHVCSRSNTMADLERAVQQAEHVFSLSLNAGAPLDIISYNTMLDVYAQAGKGHQAESLLQTMFQNWQSHQEQQKHEASFEQQQDEHYSRYHDVVEPDIISFNTTAAAWARSTPGHEAPERLHALWQAMLDPQHYGQLPACRQGPSNIFYNTLLLAWAKSGRPDAGEGAEEFLRAMIHRASLSSSSSSPSSRLHHGSIYDEESLMARKQCEQQHQPDIISYGTVAYAYSQVGRAEDAERIARELYQAFLETPPDNVQRREALRPTTVLLTHVMDAWARSPLTTIQGEDRVARIRAIIDDMHRLYEEGILSDPPDTWTWNVLLRCIVDMATAAGTGTSSRKNTGERNKPKKLMQEALDLLKVMKKQPNHRARPNSWSYSAIILGFLEQRQLQQALELLHQACDVEKVNIDIRTIGQIILTAVSKSEGGRKELKKGTVLLHQLFDACEPGTTLVAQSDESNEKRRILSSGGQPTASLVGAVVAGWSRICKRSSNRSHSVADNALLACQEATSVMERMRAMHKAGYLMEGPDEGIMRLVVSCWARVSRSDNPQYIKKQTAVKALQYLQEMRQMAKTDPGNRTMFPDLETYDEVLRCLATAREPQRAETLLKQMIDDYNQRGTGTNTAKPNAECFNSVLLGWALVSSPSNAEVATSRAQGVLDAMRLTLSANRETYHHMIHVWSNAGRPDIAENIFHRMKEEYQKDLTMVKDNKNKTKDPGQQGQERNCSTLQPTTHSYRRIIQAWTAMPSSTTGSFNPERAERLLLEMYQWFKSGENDKVCPFPECFHMVAQAWHQLAMTQPNGGEQERQFRKRAEYILSLNRDLHRPSSPSSTK